MTGGTLSQTDFTPEACQRPEVVALAKRLQVEADDNPDPNAMSPATLILTLKDGTVLERTVRHALGHPKNPMTRAQRVEK